MDELTIDSAYSLDETTFSTEMEETSFSVLSSIDFEKINRIVQERMEALSAAKPTLPPFQPTEHLRALKNLVNSHSLPIVIRGTCNQWISALEKQFQRIIGTSEAQNQKRELIYRATESLVGKLLYLGDRFPSQTEQFLRRSEERR